ncbi:hypothetical protein E4U53_001399, partial [Claviceps sorghi]
LLHRLCRRHGAVLRETRGRCPPPTTQKRQKGPPGQLAAHVPRLRHHRRHRDAGLVRHVLLVPRAQRHSLLGPVVQLRQHPRQHRPRLLQPEAERGLVHLLCQPGGHAVVQPHGHENAAPEHLSAPTAVQQGDIQLVPLPCHSVFARHGHPLAVHSRHPGCTWHRGCAGRALVPADDVWPVHHHHRRVEKGVGSTLARGDRGQGSLV